MAASSYRKPRPLNRKIEHVRDTSLIIIATEGQKTEPLYFSMEAFKKNRRTQIIIIPSDDKGSSPRSVLKRLHEYAEEHQFGEGDQFWLVIDKDRWKVEMLREIIGMCDESNYRVALSNPCFELWLLLHFRKVEELDLTENMGSNDIKEIFNPLLNERSEADYDSTYARWVPQALAEAPKLDTYPDAPFPVCPGTRVYRLVEELLK